MKLQNNRYLTYYLLINDFDFKDDNIFEITEKLFQNGITTCQIRIKKHKLLLLPKVIRLKKMCKKYKIIFIINDYINYAKILQADGVHLGQQNIKILHKFSKKRNKMIFGISATNASELMLADSLNPDYIGVGAIYPSLTKDNVHIFTDFAALKKINTPYIFIGGLTKGNVAKLNKYNYSGIAISNHFISNPNNLLDIKKISHQG